MNNAIWLVYLGGVCENVQGVFAVTGGIGLIAAGIWGVINAVEEADRPPPRWLLVLSPILVGVAVFMPSKNVLYAEAALSAGDAALKTPTGDKAMRAINAWLDRQIADDGKGK